MQLQGYGVVEARPTYAHVGYESASFTDFVIPTPNPSHVAALLVALLVICLGTLTLALHPRSRRSFAKRLGLVFVAALMGYAGGYGWVVSHGAHTRFGRPAPEVLHTLLTLEELTAEADRELGTAPPSEAWLESWRARNIVDGWGNPLVIEGPPSGAPLGQGRQFNIRSPEYGGQVMRHSRNGPELSTWMLGPDGRFGTVDDESTAKTLAYYLRIDRSENDGSVLRKLAAKERH